MEDSPCEFHSMFPGGLYKSVEQCGDEISEKDPKAHRACYADTADDSTCLSEVSQARVGLQRAEEQVGRKSDFLC